MTVVATGLRLSGVSFAFGDAIVLERLDLEVPAGQFIALLGPSGSGKSTLLRLVAGLEQPGAGRVRWAGEDVTTPHRDRGMVFQDYALFPWLTLEDNVALAVAQSEPAADRNRRRAIAGEFLASVGLGQAIRKRPAELSGGMQQRGAIARALALGCSLLLMDEPFGALDPVNRMRLQDLLVEMWSARTPRRTILFVTHDVDEALYLADRVVVLGASPGRIIADLEVPADRPRSRARCDGDPAYESLRHEIAQVLRRDVAERVAQELTMAGAGAGI